MKWFRKYWKDASFKYTLLALLIVFPGFDLLIYAIFRDVQFGGTIIGGVIASVMLLFAFLYRDKD